MIIDFTNMQDALFFPLNPICNILFIKIPLQFRFMNNQNSGSSINSTPFSFATPVYNLSEKRPVVQ